MFFTKKISWLLGILTVYIVLSTTHLETLPSEWFGDVDITHYYISEILSGNWPTYFSTSVGPIYHYLISPIIFTIGSSYLSYKISSIVIGLLGIISIYVLGKEVYSEKIGLLSSAIAATSFWYLVWARLGTSPQMVLPILSSLCIVCIIRYETTSKNIWIVLGSVVSCIGLFTYPAAFLLPLLLMMLLLLKVIDKPFIKHFVSLVLAITLCSLGGVLFFKTIKDEFLNKNSYLGEKVYKVSSNSLSNNSLIFVENYIRTLGMFNFTGDEVFRWNVPRKPHLDIVSGILLWIGVVWVVRERKAKYLIFPILLLIILSASPSFDIHGIPQSGRTFIVVPFVFVLIARGLHSMSQFIENNFKIEFAYSFLFFLLTIVVLNVHKYYLEYPAHLPMGNFPLGLKISDYIDKLPSKIEVIIPECSWEEWGSPSCLGILNNLNIKRKIVYDIDLRCEKIKAASNTSIIIGPRNLDLKSRIVSCNPNFIEQRFYFDNKDRFTAFEILAPSF